MIIKILLIGGLIAAGLLLLRGQPSPGRLALRRIAIVTVLIFGVVGVLFPLLVTRVANLVGVQRGTDLVLYMLVVTFLFVTLSLYQRLHVLQECYVALARKVALDETRHASGRDAGAPPNHPETVGRQSSGWSTG